MDHLNDVVGTDNMGNERVMRRHTYGKLNDSCERPVKSGGIRNLFIEAGTLFSYKYIHKIYNDPGQK